MNRIHLTLVIVLKQARSNSKSANFTAKIDYFVNKCGGVIDGGRKITITSPNYPITDILNKNHNCAWLVILSDEGSVNVSTKSVKSLNVLTQNQNKTIIYY